MTPPDTALIEALSASRLAQGLQPDQVAVLATVVRLANYRAKDVLGVEGHPDNHLYALVEGSLGVVRHMGTPDETLVATLRAGDFAHELGFLDGVERYASLVAASDVRVLVLEREGLESLVDSHPRVAFGVMRAIVRVVHRAEARMSMQTAELTNYIVKQHDRY